MISRPCDHCGLTKRCKLWVDASHRVTDLCRPCARELGYVDEADNV